MSNPGHVISTVVTQYLLDNGYESTTPDLMDKVIALVPGSNSQLTQDIFVQLILNFKENGYFVEFGAADGYEFSNTFLLENAFNWDGILVEPAKSWAPANNLRKCNVDFRCVAATSGQTVMFNDAEIKFLSSTKEIIGTDTIQYGVETVSLNDLLEQYNAPEHINYLSVDTKGGELQILETLDFNKYSFDVITVDHNFSEARVGVYDLLTSKGYFRVCNEISWIDDWYVSEEHVGNLVHTNNMTFSSTQPPTLQNRG
jgi:FkbM family methyltransferase